MSPVTGTGRVGGLGVFGGTFDPLHLGHLAAAQDTLEFLGLGRILLVPARHSPHKAGEPHASAESRLRMVREAVADDPRFEVTELELRRAGPSYTIDTLGEIAAGNPGVPLVLMIGVDQWASFGRWRRPREILEVAALAVMTREGEHPADADPGFDDGGPPPSFVEVPVTRMDISSTALRRRASAGASLRYLVPDPVRRIIEAEKLYLPD
jgi:nicotinate-nucleotide adenylyltransferase